jgi:photosystem II stability/assembly factor-like uncharacterized protein
MRTNIAIVVCAAGLAMAGCKKSGTGGGGGGWLVGAEGLMANIEDDGTMGAGYDLGASEALNAIACRYEGEAWVVGNSGTLLYTSDGGQAWESQVLPTAGNLHALATQDAGPVFIGGDGILLTAQPDANGAAQWTQLGDGVASFRSIAAAQRGSTVLAISDDGGLWSYENQQFVRRTTIAGAKAIAVSPDGQTAIIAGTGLSRSTDAGRTWTALPTDLSYASVRIDDRGESVAVGAAGVVARVDYEGRVLLQQVGTGNLRTLHLATWDAGGLGYAAGDGGQVWITNDSGWSWAEGPNLGRTVLGVDQIGEGHN